MKKLLSIILAILMIVTTVPIAFAAEVEAESPYAVIDTNAGTLTIDGTLGGKGEATDEDITALTETIKSSVDNEITTIIVTGSELAIYNGYYDNYPAYAEALYYVTEEDRNSKYCGTIDLTLLDVTEIGKYEYNVAFSLKSVTLPKVTTIGDAAFWECSYLQTLTFGSVVTSIGSRVAFADVGLNVEGGTDLVLNCGQMQTEGNYKPNLETNEWGYNSSWEEVYKWKSITLTHTPEADDGNCTTEQKCTVCGGVAVAAKENHTGGTATCTELAKCDLCGTEYGDINADNHKDTLVQVDAKTPICDAIGWDAYEYCTACDYTTYIEKAALNHKDTLVQVEAKAPTCTEIGWDAYEYCTACDYTTYVEIPENGHTPLDAVRENEVASKCGLAGSYDLVVYCACGEELDRDKFTVEALTHSFTKYEVTEEAKCGVEGKEVAACDNGCGETDEKAIAALTHKDADGDYKCDNGCGHEFEKPAPEEPTPDTPDEPTDDACDHLCHKSGIFGFFWKIVKFFSKLFKLNPVCECGAAHY